jgi:DNA-binding CsgD family transcriptional regulator
MLHSDEQALALVDKFQSAALGMESWYSALAGLADVTGSRTGQLIVIGTNAHVPINVMTNTDPDLHPAFAALRGGDPDINPRVRAGMNAPVLEVLAENDFITPEEHRTHQHYQEFARPWDIPYICLTTLDRRHDLLVGLAVNRSEREGHISESQRRIFESLAPHVRAAVRIQMSLEDQGIALLSGVLESLAVPAFLCERSGRVTSMTPAAEEMIARGDVLRIKSRQLTAAMDFDARALSAAIEAAADAHSAAFRPPQTLVVRSACPTSAPLVLDVVRLPSPALEFNPKARVLIVPHGFGDREGRRRIVLRSVYKLTEAETDVAMQLLQGRTVESIASSRDVRAGTVRLQIKCILAKCGVSRQVELVAKLGQL